MKRVLVALAYAAAAYIAAAGAGYFLVMRFSGNVHDRDVEAAITSMFVFGPAAAIVAFVVGVMRRPRRGSTHG